MSGDHVATVSIILALPCNAASDASRAGAGNHQAANVIAGKCYHRQWQKDTLDSRVAAAAKLRAIPVLVVSLLLYVLQ